jgi:hypothetical protein
VSKTNGETDQIKFGVDKDDSHLVGVSLFSVRVLNVMGHPDRSLEQAAFKK